MAQEFGLGRGLASLIPQSPAQGVARHPRQKPVQSKSDAKKQVAANDDTQANVSTPISPRQLRNAAKSPVTVSSDIESDNINTNNVTLTVPRSAIVANPHQPRTTFDATHLNDLAASIRIHGIMQPLVVTQIATGYYELIAGERRFRAAEIAGLDMLPVIVRTASAQDKLELALIENIQRHDLNVIEEARAYQQLADDFGLLQEDIATRMGKSRSVVANRMRLLKLPVSIMKLVSGGQLSDGHAKVILSLENTEAQHALAQMIVSEQLTVRQTEVRAAIVRSGGISNRTSRTPAQLPAITRVQQHLTSTLGTKVTIIPRGRGGRIVIEYYAPEDLRALEDKMTAGDGSEK